MKKKIPLIGLFIALSMIFSYIEVLLPLNLGIPGIKLGLSNLVIIVSIYCIGKKEAFFILCFKIILAGLLFGSMSSILYSLSGGLLSYIVMALLEKLKAFTPTGVSVAGGVCHNIGQLIIAIFVLHTKQIIYYLPFLLLSGTMAGLIVGMIGALVIRRFSNIISKVEI